MTPAQNKEIVGRLFQECYSNHDFNAVTRYLDTNYVLHDPTAPNIGRGLEGWRKFQEIYVKAFPDMQCQIEFQAAEGDFVVTRWAAVGTHKGDLMGIRATNKPVKITGITISRLVNGKIVEEWQNWDTAGLYQQLGVQLAKMAA